MNLAQYLALVAELAALKNRFAAAEARIATLERREDVPTAAEEQVAAALAGGASVRQAAKQTGLSPAQTHRLAVRARNRVSPASGTAPSDTAGAAL